MTWSFPEDLDFREEDNVRNVPLVLDRWGFWVGVSTKPKKKFNLKPTLILNQRKFRSKLLLYSNCAANYMEIENLGEIINLFTQKTLTQNQLVVHDLTQNLHLFWTKNQMEQRAVM